MKKDILKALNGKKISSKKGWIVLFDNERLVMNSGKLIWDKKQHASNALLHSIKDVTRLRSTLYNNLALHEYVKELEQEGRIKYQEI